MRWFISVKEAVASPDVTARSRAELTQPRWFPKRSRGLGAVANLEVFASVGGLGGLGWLFVFCWFELSVWGLSYWVEPIMRCSGNWTRDLSDPN